MFLPRRIRRKRRRAAPRAFRPQLVLLEDRLTPAAGALDPSFGTGGTAMTDIVGPARDFAQGIVAIQADGKVVLAGASQNGSVSQFALARYMANGTLDTTFGTNGQVLTDFPTHFAVARGMALQPDGKIVVVGLARVSGGPSDFALARFNVNGSVDTTFGAGGMVMTDFYGDNDEARGVVIKPDGTIYVAGTTIDPTSGAFTDFALASYTSSGVLIPTFGVGGKTRFDFSGGDDLARGIALQTDGRLVVAGSTINFLGATLNDIGVARFLANGAVDTGFGVGGKAIVDIDGNDDFGRGVTLTAAGKIAVIGTSFDNVTDLGDMALVCMTSGGALDVSMSYDGLTLVDFGGDDVGRSVSTDSAGRIVIAGSRHSAGSDVFAVARLMPDGVMDGAFGSGGKLTTSFGTAVDQAASIAVFSDNCIVAAGQTVCDFAVAKYGVSGTLDSSFSGDGKATIEFVGSGDDRGAATAIQPDGKIIVAGTTTNLGSTTADDFVVARYLANGSLDATFGVSGIVTTDFAGNSDFAHGVAIQTDGRIVVVGLSFTATGVDFALARYNANGSLDTTFGAGGKVLADLGGTDTATSVVIQPDGKILVAGHSFNFTSGTLLDMALARFTTTGGLDASFGSGGIAKLDFSNSEDFAFDMALRSDGKIIVVGTTGPFGSNDLALARFTQGGLLDPSFGGTGKATLDLGGNEEGKALAILTNGKLLVGGNSGGDWLFARYEENGVLDSGFGTNGRTLLDFFGESDRLNDLVIQADGRIVGAGAAGDMGGNPALPDFALARLKKNGDLNKPFGANGKVVIDFGSGNDSAAALALQADGKIVAAGAAFAMASNSNLAVMRLEGGNGNGENNDSERTSRLDGTWGVKAKTRVSSTATTRSMDTPRTGRPALGTQIKPRPHNTGEANSGASHSDQLVACWDLPLELVSD